MLGRYRIVARLAKGGMGVVFLARAEGAAGFAKPVVVKRILPDMSDERMTRMFIREARILSNLQHPGIVSIIDFGEEDGAYLMVLDYVRAYHLGRWMRYLRRIEEPFPVDIALHVVIKVLEALEYAHTLALPDGTPLNIVHADISPSNILIDGEGQVKLVDFGIARVAGEGVTAATDSGSVSIKGKFAYLAPELLSGATASVRSDVYASAVVLYELLAGHGAFQSADMHQTISRVLLETLPRLDLERPDVTPELAQVLARALSKQPSERFGSAAELASELRRVRKMPEDAAAAALTAMVRRDYQGDMPAKMGLTPLNELETAWRTPPAIPISLESVDSIPVLVAPPPDEKEQKEEKAPAAPRTRSDQPTALSPVSFRQSGPPPPPVPVRRARTWIPVAVLGVVGVGAGGAFYATRGKASDPQPAFILVEHGAASTASSAGAEPPPSAAGSTEEPSTDTPQASAPEPATASGHAAAGVHTTATTPSSRAEALSAAFARHQPQIEACFRDNVASLKGSPEISVRFSVDAAGRVQRAELLPVELASLPLGQCLLRVAHTTRFPAQQAPATFRIPIRAKR